MQAPGAITRDRFDAVLFDLDGVLTDTARVHASSWKHMFDDFLRARADETGEPFRAFTFEEDYKLHVDGKPRFDGVRAFLRSRGIELPEGSTDDPRDAGTVGALGNWKNELFNEELAEGVEVYGGSVALVRHLHDIGIRTAVVSSSRNCEAVLRAARMTDLFELWVVGKVAARLELAGKPAPDTFLSAARQLGVEPGRAVVVEDAISGVQAGKAGDFGLVVGVDREDNPGALREAGADLVVTDLAELLPGC